MPEVQQPQDMTTWMREMERRVRNIETAPKLLTVQYTHVRAVETFLSCTSGTFVTTWELPLGRVVNDAIQVAITTVCPAGTDGELQLRVANAWGNPTTAVRGLTAGGQDTTYFNWLVPGMADDQNGAGVIIQVQARRTAGTGSISIYDPDVALQCSGFSINATETGVPA